MFNKLNKIPPKGRRAHLVVEEDYEIEEEIIIKKTHKSGTKKLPKKNTNIEESEEDEEFVNKNSTKKNNKNENEIEAVAVIYTIESEKHPFHYLNGVPDSVEIEKLDCTKNEVYNFKIYK